MLIDIATHRSPRYWRDCAAKVRRIRAEETNPALCELMEGCEADYERLALRAEAAIRERHPTQSAN